LGFGAYLLSLLLELENAHLAKPGLEQSGPAQRLR
jgi:hypothetical protein